MSKAERELHRRIGASSFNEAWELLDRNDRSSQEDLEMLHLAHTSAYHWAQVGTAEHWAVADWQLSRVYAELGQGDLALRFARACLSKCRKNGLEKFVPTAYEALARAYAALKDQKNATKWLMQARRSLEKVDLDKEDREVYTGQIKDTQRLIDTLQG